jgi:hypothetical protein
MTRSIFACRNPRCRDPTTGHRTILGYVRHDCLTVNPDVCEWFVDPERGFGWLSCPVCGQRRSFHHLAAHQRRVLT